jgi:hypothetical protein
MQTMLHRTRPRTKVPTNIQSPIGVRSQWFDKGIDFPCLCTIDIRFLKENELLRHVRIKLLDKIQYFFIGTGLLRSELIAGKCENL